MKYIVLILIFISVAFGSVIRSPLVSVGKNIATIKVNKINVGMSGFIIHKISDNHTIILKSVVVENYDKNSKIATLKLSQYKDLRQNSLPSGKWKVQVGDTALLAFGYTRALLIAPSEEIYHRITASTKDLQWIHPDLFATMLSLSGHPTPLREDFLNLSVSMSVGLVFIYLNKKVFTLDSRTFKILNISDAPLVQKSEKLPFYTRVKNIEADWWGEGSDELEAYAPHYYQLILEANPYNKELRKLTNETPYSSGSTAKGMLDTILDIF